MMPTFPSSPLKFRTAGFPQYGFKAGFQRRPSFPDTDVAYPSSLPSAFVRNCIPYFSPLCVGDTGARHAPPCERFPALPQGPSLRFGF
jgi:hypothetical protein